MASTATTFVPFSPSNVGPDEIEEVVATLESGWLTTGPRVRRFEADFAAYTGAPHAVAVNSCTAALHLSLLACGVGPGDEVVTTPLTFCATANVVVHTGATPVFADIDPSTWNGTAPGSAWTKEAAATRRRLDVGDRRIVIGVDRLDYTKGIPDRLLAFDRFLERYPEWRNRVPAHCLSAPAPAVP